ncbi:hypothetical protein SNE40_009101 [Patella caerulea]|uniref:PID domain-containing protein n=1 Tax=Patella caerulea TaxID=87958 RepID=A0AAN8JN87_PATCE
MERNRRSKRFYVNNIMQSLKRRLSFRKKKDHVPECSKPHQWQEDEKKVREGTCSFQVRYLGCIEVFDSRGMQVCEEAVKALKNQCKGKVQRAVLYVSGDALRVVDEISKSMIVDQTIEKVSFCAPDRNHEKGFAYICRDGTTRRWMCHGFMAVKETVSGERLSHAVGCAFAVCLEKKQKRDKETGVTVTFSQDRTSFTRTGSFRQTSLTERLADPQSAILAEPVPVRRVDNPFAVQRPHATPELFNRQGSFRGFEKLQEASSPFKRTLSLRLNDLPSTLQRQNAIMESPSANGAVGGTIHEESPEQEDSIAQMCQQLTQGLTALTSDEAFNNTPTRRGAEHHGLSLHHQHSAPSFQPPSTTSLPRQNTIPSSTYMSQAAPQTNPWASNTAETNGTHNQYWNKPTSPTNPFVSQPARQPAASAAVVNGVPLKGDNFTQPIQAHQRSNAFQNMRSHSIDTGELPSAAWAQAQNRKPTLLQMAAHQRSFQENGTDTSNWATSALSTTSPTHSKSQGVDPFDVAWAAKQSNKNSNPFGSKSVKQFEVQL